MQKEMSMNGEQLSRDKLKRLINKHRNKSNLKLFRFKTMGKTFNYNKFFIIVMLWTKNFKPKNKKSTCKVLRNCQIGRRS